MGEVWEETMTVPGLGRRVWLVLARELEGTLADAPPGSLFIIACSDKNTYRNSLMLSDPLPYSKTSLGTPQSMLDS